jgi:hypothetical protein
MEAEVFEHTAISQNFSETVLEMKNMFVSSHKFKLYEALANVVLVYDGKITVYHL